MAEKVLFKFKHSELKNLKKPIEVSCLNIDEATMPDEGRFTIKRPDGTEYVATVREVTCFDRENNLYTFHCDMFEVTINLTNHPEYLDYFKRQCNTVRVEGGII